MRSKIQKGQVFANKNSADEVALCEILSVRAGGSVEFKSLLPPAQEAFLGEQAFLDQFVLVPKRQARVVMRGRTLSVARQRIAALAERYENGLGPKGVLVITPKSAPRGQAVQGDGWRVHELREKGKPLRHLLVVQLGQGKTKNRRVPFHLSMPTVTEAERAEWAKTQVPAMRQPVPESAPGQLSLPSAEEGEDLATVRFLAGKDVEQAVAAFRNLLPSEKGKFLEHIWQEIPSLFVIQR